MSSNTEVPIFKRTANALPEISVILSAAKDLRILRESPRFRMPHLRAQFYRTLRWVLTIAVLALFTHPAHAQGCAQCLDSTRATPPTVQAAYRHAIYLLIGAASTIFLIGLYLLRREP